MIAVSREGAPNVGKSSSHRSSRAGAQNATQNSPVSRLKSWLGARTLGLMGVGGHDLSDLFVTLEGSSLARG